MKSEAHEVAGYLMAVTKRTGERFAQSAKEVPDAQRWALAATWVCGVAIGELANSYTEAMKSVTLLTKEATQVREQWRLTQRELNQLSEEHAKLKVEYDQLLERLEPALRGLEATEPEES